MNFPSRPALAQAPAGKNENSGSKYSFAVGKTSQTGSLNWLSCERLPRLSIVRKRERTYHLLSNFG